MKYLGGKARLAKPIASAILENTNKRERYIEPFVGGASVLISISSEFSRCFATDTHPDLILMYKALQEGWVPPHHVSEDEYNALKAAAPSPLRGFVGFACSFSGKWFGGYARGQRQDGTWRNYACEGANRLERGKQAYENTVFANVSYDTLKLDDRYVVYCDPPYDDTQGYSNGEFDSTAFWDWARGAAATGADVFVSEFSVPTDTEEVWSKDRKITVDKKGGKTKRELLVKVND